MPFRDKVYGQVAAKAGVPPQTAKLAVDAAVEAMRGKLPANVYVSMISMLDHVNGTWGAEAEAERPENLKQAAPPITVKAAEPKTAAPIWPRGHESKPAPARPTLVPTMLVKGVTGKTFGRRLKELFGK